MAERWRKQTTDAFRFWHLLLVGWDDSSDNQARYAPLITHLRQFEKKSHATFKYVVERGADPVYLLFILLLLCDEERVQAYRGFPQVQTQEKSGSLSDLRDFHFVTESEFHAIEAALPASKKAGLPLDQNLITMLKQGFETLPAPPVIEGVMVEKAILHTQFTFQAPDPQPSKGRPGEHYFNTAMVLLARHLEHTNPSGAWYTSIAKLLNTFCPATYAESPLSNETVRQRIRSVRDRAGDYCDQVERWFEGWKRLLHQSPLPFHPWTPA